MAKGAVGMEVGSFGVRLACVHRGRTGPALTHLAEQQLPEGTFSEGTLVNPDALTAAVSTVLRSVKLTSREITLGVVNQQTLAREVEMPWVPTSELRQALPLLTADLVAIPTEECVLDFLAYQDVHDADGQRWLRGLLVAAPTDTVMDVIDAVEAANAAIGDVTLSPLATLRLVGDEHAGGPEGLIDVGSTVTVVTIHEGGQPRFMRVISRGGRDITAALADTLGLTEADAERWKCALPMMWPSMSSADRATTETAVRAALADLVAEIRTSIDFYATAHGKRLAVAYAIGGSARMIGLVPVLNAALRLPVRAVSVRETGIASALPANQPDLSSHTSLTSVVAIALGAVA